MGIAVSQVLASLEPCFYARFIVRMALSLEFSKSKFSYLTIGKYRKDRCLKISDFSIQVFVFSYKQILKRRMFENLGFF